MKKWIENLNIYNISIELSNSCWEVYNKFNYEIKKIIWDQFIRAIDSIWANIAEWYGRFHYADSVKFYYYARWSMEESKHWIFLLKKRWLIDDILYTKLNNNLIILQKKLNNFIKYTKENK